MLVTLRSDWTVGGKTWPAARCSRSPRRTTSRASATSRRCSRRRRRPRSTDITATKTMIYVATSRTSQTGSYAWTRTGAGKAARGSARRSKLADGSYRRRSLRGTTTRTTTTGCTTSDYLTPSIARRSSSKRQEGSTLKQSPSFFDAKRPRGQRSTSRRRRTARACPTSMVAKTKLRARRQHADAARRLRRLRDLADAVLQRGRRRGVARARRRVRRRRTSAAAASTARPGTRRRSRRNRQRVYDDFVAVAEDLIARKVTSPPIASASRAAPTAACSWA